jgi:hypothetical protein
MDSAYRLTPSRSKLLAFSPSLNTITSSMSATPTPRASSARPRPRQRPVMRPRKSLWQSTRAQTTTLASSMPLATPPARNRWITLSTWETSSTSTPRALTAGATQSVESRSPTPNYALCTTTARGMPRTTPILIRLKVSSRMPGFPFGTTMKLRIIATV